MAIILGSQGIAAHHRGVLAATTTTSNINSNNVTDSNLKNIQENNILLTKIWQRILKIAFKKQVPFLK